MTNGVLYWLLVVCAAAIELNIPFVTNAATLVLISTLTLSVIERY